MKASILLNLYPDAWRDRYESEFRAMLDDHPVSAMDALDIIFGAVDAHLRPHAHRIDGAAVPPGEASTPRRGSGLEALFFAHLSLFVAVIMVLGIINVATTAGNWWSLYPLWAWGTIVAVHGLWTFRWKGLLGAHVAFYLGLNAGLITTNIVQGGAIWFIWPLIALGVLVASHLLIVFQKISLIRAHLTATVLGLALVFIALLAAGAFDIAVILLVGVQLGVLLAGHWLMRRQGWNLLATHAFIYAGTLLLLLVNNLIEDPGDLWVRYPFAVWTILLTGHALLHFRIAKWSGSDWEAIMLEELGTREASDTQRQMLGALFLHVSVFLLGAIAFVALNLMTGISDFWAIWPIGVWYVLLAFHAGYVLAPRRITGSLLFGWVATSAGLIAIDFFSDGDPWWYWPVMWSAVVVAIALGATWGKRHRLIRMHLLGGIALAFALVVTDLVTGPPLWWFYAVAAIILTWVIHFGLTLDFTKAINPLSDDQ